MTFIIDLIIIGIIVLFTFIGYKRGLVKVALHLCTFVIAIIIAFLLYKPVANIVINNTNIDENITLTITDKILPDGATADDEVDLSNDLPNIILRNSENTVKSIANSISIALIQIVCLIAIFIIAKIVLKFVTVLADLIAKLPILKQFNELGGTIYGFAEGFLIVFVGLAIISLIAPIIGTDILNAINDSIVGSLLYNNNLLLKFLI